MRRHGICRKFPRDISFITRLTCSMFFKDQPAALKCVNHRAAFDLFSVCGIHLINTTCFAVFTCIVSQSGKPRRIPKPDYFKTFCRNLRSVPIMFLCRLYPFRAVRHNANVSRINQKNTSVRLRFSLLIYQRHLFFNNRLNLLYHTLSPKKRTYVKIFVFLCAVPALV